MSNDYPNPWNFSNADKNLFSPNGEYKIEFGELYEIAMGGPIGGECFLIFDNKRVKLSDSSGGPVIWNLTSDKVAFPIWTKDRNQKISVVDIPNFTITIFKKEFRVLHFNKFDDIHLTGIDSPIYMTRNFSFDIKNEEIESTKKLQ